MTERLRVMCDSGIFTAWQKKEALPVEDYIAYLRDHSELFDSYVSMDSIPGQWGQKRSLHDLETSAELSYRNHQKMKDAGLSPIPVFHQGESFKWLDRYIADGETYIGISHQKDLWAKQQEPWLDDVFTRLTDHKGMPLVRTHGFGLARPGFLMRYPWTTVDSTSWELQASHGWILVPRREQSGAANYALPPVQVAVTGVYESLRQLQSMGPSEIDWVHAFLESCGLTVTQVRNSRTLRGVAIVRYYQKLTDTLKDVRFRYRRMYSVIDREPIKGNHLRFVFAATVDGSMTTRALFDCGVDDVLVSYYLLRNVQRDALTRYVIRELPTSPQTVPRQKWSNEAYKSFRRMKLYERLETTNGQG